MTAAPSLTLAHLSDVHLGPIVGFHPRFWNAKRATGYFNWRRNRRDAYSRAVLDRIVADVHATAPDHIAVTGDLCNIGLPAEMDQALRWLAGLGPPTRVSVIPGNHDVYTTIGRDHGISRWASYMAGDPDFDFPSSLPARADRPSVAFPYVRRLGGVALIGLNSAVETPPFVAAGQLGADQRGRLAAILDETASLGLFRLVMIHHPPLPRQTRRSHGLNDAAALRDVLATHGAELVIHGHLHRNTRASLACAAGGSIPVIGVPSASLGHVHQHEPLARYNLITIAGSRIVIIGRGIAVPDGPVIELEHITINLERRFGSPHEVS